jgi:hypothetical protein
MASLWSLASKSKIATDVSGLEESLLALRTDLQKRSAHLVNVNDLIGPLKEAELTEAIDFTPCHPALWLEWLDVESYRREAIYLTRYSAADLSPTWIPANEAPENSRHLIQLATWQEYQACAVLRALAWLFIDDLGRPIGDFDYCGAPGNADAVGWRVFVAQEIMTIMNTRGTRIEPPLEEGSRAEVMKPNRAPHSVWHTIHLPKFQGPPLTDAEVTPEVLERRQHWVRAHRKDYREGAGMFGRIKALVWIPEFQRGNPELGTVKQSFTVHPRPEERRP